MEWKEEGGRSGNNRERSGEEWERSGEEWENKGCKGRSGKKIGEGVGRNREIRDEGEGARRR